MGSCCASTQANRIKMCRSRIRQWLCWFIDWGPWEGWCKLSFLLVKGFYETIYPNKDVSQHQQVRLVHVDYVLGWGGHLLSLHSGWKMRPQGPGIWPGWKALHFFSLHSANRGKYVPCQHVTDIPPPHHSHCTPSVAQIYPRTEPKHTGPGGNSQFELLEHGQHTLWWY